MRIPNTRGAAFLIALLLICSSPAWAQVSGLLIDNQTLEPLAGVQVYQPNSSNGTLSNNQGEFELSPVPGNDSLIVQMVGYEPSAYSIGQLPSVIKMQQSAVQLNQIVISATRDARERVTLPVAISSIRPQVLEEAKATSIDQVVNKVPGVFMSDLGNEQHMMAIRQPISTKSIFLYLEDGIPIRTSGVFNHNALLEINMAATRSIEVIRGPYSSFYGSEAIGGAINFITTRPSAVPTARLSLQGNNLGYRRGDLQLSNTFDKVGTSISGYYAQRRNGYREHSDFDKLALTGQVDINFSPNTQLRNSITVIDYQSDMTGSLDSAFFFGQEYSSQHTFTHRSVNAIRLKSALTHFWSENSKTDFTLIGRNNSIKQNPSYRVRDDYSPWGNPNGNPNLAHGEVNDNSFMSLAGILQHRQEFDFAGAALTGGASFDLSPNTYKAKYIDVMRDDDGIYTAFNESDSVLTDYSVGLVNLAAYAQGEISPCERLKVLGAIRVDQFNYNYDNSLDSNAFSGAPDAKNSFTALTPKLGLTYRIQPGIGLYGNYSRGMVPPQVGELYRGVKVPSLEAALFDNYEIGGWLSFWNKKASLDFGAYVLEGRNEIISVQLDNGDRQNQNAGQTRHMGIEYGLNLQPLPELSLRLSASNAAHSYEDFVENGVDLSGNVMAAAPSFIANSEMTYRPSFLEGFRIGLEVQHVGKYYMDGANEKEYPGFTLFNLRAGYSWKGLEAWFNVLNLGDELYATRATRSRWGDSYTPGDPRTFNIGLGYRIQGKTK